MLPADFFLLHEDDATSRLIQLGTHGRWNHCGLIVDGSGGIVEALAQGVAADNLSRYAGKAVAIVDTGLTDVERAVAVTFAQSCVGDAYDRLDIISFALNIATDGTVILGQAGRYICSALIWRALQQASYTRFAADCRTISPNDLARWGKVAT